MRYYTSFIRAVLDRVFPGSGIHRAEARQEPKPPPTDPPTLPLPPVGPEPPLVRPYVVLDESAKCLARILAHKNAPAAGARLTGPDHQEELVVVDNDYTHLHPITSEADEADQVVADLKAVLSSLGITLPSLEVDIISRHSGLFDTPLIELGRVNVATARQLTQVLRRVAQ